MLLPVSVLAENGRYDISPVPTLHEEAFLALDGFLTSSSAPQHSVHNGHLMLVRQQTKHDEGSLGSQVGGGDVSVPAHFGHIHYEYCYIPSGLRQINC